jgi:hypothetical protein
MDMLGATTCAVDGCMAQAAKKQERIVEQAREGTEG